MMELDIEYLSINSKILDVTENFSNFFGSIEEKSPRFKIIANF